MRALPGTCRMTVAGPWAQQYRLGNGRIPPAACRGGGILRLVHKEVLMNIAVRYYTKTGNTKRLAEAVAGAVGVEALPISTPVSEPVDILFLGNSYYAFSIDPEVRDFVRSLDKEKVGDRKSTRLNSSHRHTSRMPSSA